jgi:putative adenylate-forming enzyme
MKIGFRRRVADVAGGLRLSREFAKHERQPREELRLYQQQRLESVIRHAAEHSPFYRERFARIIREGPVELSRLPVLDKSEMMEHFDELVTDGRLRRDALLRWVEGLERDELYLDRYRVMTTSGSSGRKGLFVFDRPEWRMLISQFLRYSAMSGIRPRLPRRLRVAAVIGASPTHMSRQISASISVGIHRVSTLSVTQPLEQLVDRLNRYQPQFMAAYPSIATRLAEEQLAGRLRITLAGMSTSSELRTPEMTKRIVEAFGVHPFDHYATTEGLWGCECEYHQGVHLFEDFTLVENVDDARLPVPVGEPGTRLLVTSLHNLVQPIIRLELPDAVTLDPGPCPCGRTLIRTRAIEGRTDDVLYFPDRRGGEVMVHPLQFGIVTRNREVREFQVIQDGEGVRILVVTRPSASEELNRRLRDAVPRKLTDLGVREPRVSVERRENLARSAGGKLQLVVADPAARTAHHGFG